MQKQTISSSKNCHNSDLNSTNCKAFARIWRKLLLKTRWKLFNSTRKTGVAAGLLHNFHRVFNLWKKYGPFTKCIDVFCGKLFASAKRRKCAPPPGQRAKHFYRCPVRWERCILLKKFRCQEIKSRQFVAKSGEIWYTLSWIIINKIKRSGAAQPARNGRSIKKMEDRNQPRRPRRDAEQPQQKSESLIYGKNPVTELL